MHVGKSSIGVPEQAAAFIAIGISLCLFITGIGIFVYIYFRSRKYPATVYKRDIHAPPLSAKLVQFTAIPKIMASSADIKIDELDDAINMKKTNESCKPDLVDNHWNAYIDEFGRQKNEESKNGYYDYDLWQSGLWDDPERPSVLSIGGYL